VIECIPKDTIPNLANSGLQDYGWQHRPYNPVYDNTTPLSLPENIIAGNDPEIWYELRSKGWSGQPTVNANKVVDNWQGELISANFNAKNRVVLNLLNPFQTALQTPGGAGDDEAYETTDLGLNSTLDVFTPARESLVLLAPINTKFRIARFRIVSEIIAKIKSLVIKSVAYRRKSI
jgi:hypothetical protein